MQVILLERIGRLGQLGDVVNVKDGYARNYLLPQGKALRATPANMERFEREKSEIEARNEELKKQAETGAGKMDGQSYVIIRQAGDTGQLYGSVSTRDIAGLLSEAGFEVARRQVMLDTPIKILGIHPVRIALHPEVLVSITVNVARSEDEAKRQARGEDVTATEEKAQEDETISAEEVFEAEELAKKAEKALKDDEGAEEEALPETDEAEESKAAESADESSGEEAKEGKEKKAAAKGTKKKKK